jgi:isoquinoline 1-oxidoreductase subunit beta
MTIHNLSRLPKSLNRREVMIGAAGLSFGVASGLVSPCDVEFSTTANAAESATLNPWVTISADGTISIMSPASEMGQGSKTSLPLIVAEEMDAAWDKVRIVAAPPSDAIYGNPGFLGMMYTAGSTAVMGYFTELRQFGAQVRQVLLDNAAQRLGVPVSELKTEPSVVVHSKTNRRLSYGDLAAFLVVPATPPAVAPEDRGFPVDRQGRDALRTTGQGEWNGALQHRCRRARHGVRSHDLSADG